MIVRVIAKMQIRRDKIHFMSLKSVNLYHFPRCRNADGECAGIFKWSAPGTGSQSPGVRSRAYERFGLLDLRFGKALFRQIARMDSFETIGTLLAQNVVSRESAKIHAVKVVD